MKTLFALLSFTFVLSTGFSQTLKKGMAAPDIQVGSWVKGKPVTKFHKDTNYVVEFWATWCGPCIQAIPHITALSKKYPSTKFVGVAVAEFNTSAVAPFVKNMGSRMDYNVAIDKQSDPTARTGFMSENWLQAAGLTSIPATFVISNNQIVYIGHPMELEAVLKKLHSKKRSSKDAAKLKG